MTVQELGQRLARDAEAFRRRRDGQAQRFKALVTDDFAGVRRIVHLHGCLPFSRSVAVDKVDIRRGRVRP